MRGRLLLHFSRLAGVVACAAALAAGCTSSDRTAGAEDAGAPAADAAARDTSTAPDVGPFADASAGGDASGDASTTPKACTTNPDCHTGTCFEGICVCAAGSSVQPDGTCGATPPPGCVEQGGMCVSLTSTCPSGRLPGSPEANTSCGDLVQAVCCHEPATCKGPTDLLCCVADASQPPSCVNGWRTCTAAGKAYSAANANACGG